MVATLSAIRSKEIIAVLVGNGSQRHEVDKRVRTLGFDGQAILAGARKGQQTMSAFDLLVVPSRYESPGYMLLEAVACSVLFVSGPIGIAEELAGTTGSGVIVDNTVDPRFWAAVLDRALDPTRLTELSGATGKRQACHIWLTRLL